MDVVPSTAEPVVALEANDKARTRALWARDLTTQSAKILRYQPSVCSDGERKYTVESYRSSRK
ncbi:UNVERIFIED_CONTAM: hypothetical protein Sangu_2681200 [Sesamum angustifolium]|uniref:Uncharacterized protein n=1 Tax=Sesamum angustifolium TaxID=2727405 RepID=A0AAW2J0V0_9LAMI